MKNKWTKVLTLVACLSLAAAFGVACGDKGNDDPGSSGNSSESSSEVFNESESESSVPVEGGGESESESESSSIGGGTENVKGQQFESEQAWKDALQNTISQTNATLRYTVVESEEMGESYGRQEVEAISKIADGKVYGYAEGTFIYHYTEETGVPGSGEVDFTHEHYVGMVDGTVYEWDCRDDGEWECEPYEDDFSDTAIVIFYEANMMLDMFADMYDMFTYADGMYTYEMDNITEGGIVTIKFVDGKLYSCKMDSWYIDNYNKQTVRYETTIDLVASYNDATVGELPPVNLGGGETPNPGEPILPDSSVCQHQYLNGTCEQCGEEEPTAGLVYWESSDVVYVDGYNGTSARVVIPSSYEGVPVMGITANAFTGNDVVEEVIISDGVESIGEQAFYNCTKLVKIVLPDSINHVGWKAFHYTNVAKTQKDKLEYLGNDENPYVVLLGTIYNVTTPTIEDGCKVVACEAFSGRRTLTEIVIPEGVVSIGMYAFSSCESLKKITIPDSVQRIGYKAFEDCSLQQVYITDVEAWLNIAFEYEASNPIRYANLFVNNELLKTLEIPTTIDHIGDYAMRACASLETVIIPASVTNIGAYAFASCGNLTQISFTGSVEQWNNIVKGTEWVSTSVTKVVCRDGEVAL